MSFLDRIMPKRAKFGFATSPWSTPPERDSRGYLSAYSEIYSLFGITLRIATAVSEVRWRLYKGAERGDRSQIAAHPILTLLDFANEFQTGQEIIELTSLHMDLAGKAYWYLPRNKLGVPGEVWVIAPNQIKPVPSETKFIAGYVAYVGNEQIPFSTNEIIRFPMPDPLNPYGGIGYAQAAAVELDSESYSGRWNRNFFYNSARADAALEYEDKLTEDEFKRLREQWSGQHQGVSRAHKIAILEGGVKYKQIQVNQKDMDFKELRKQTRENLLFTFGMPLSVMGITENVNRANAEAGDYTFARWLIKPRLTRIKNKLNEQLLPMFKGSGIELDFDEIVPETIEQKQSLAESGVKAGWMTINEARKLNGFDPAPKGDVFLIPFNMMPTPADKPIVPPPSATPPKTKGLTEEQKRFYWTNYSIKTASQEKPFIKTLGELFNKQASEVIGNLGSKEIFDTDKANKQFADAFRPLIYEVYADKNEEALHTISARLYTNSVQKQDLPEDSIEWIEERSLKMATLINETTKDRIRKRLAEGMREGESMPKLTKRIQEFYTGEQKFRAPMVARTEVIAASNEGALNAYEREDVEESEFYPAAGACEECMALVGVYPTKEAHSMIPVHPNCRCVFLPVI